MRKLVLISLIAICLASYAKANVVSDAINSVLYEAINAVIDVKYSEKPTEERECIKKKIRDDHFAEKLTAPGLQFDNKKLRAEMDKYESDLSSAASFCEWFVFAKTPLGICIIVGIILMLLSIIIGICKCICC